MLWGTAHLYVGHRLIGPAPLTRRGRRRAWIALALAASIQPLVFLLDSMLPNAGLYLAVQWLCYVYMGLFGIVLPLLAARDLLALPARLVRRLRPFERAASIDRERRAFLANAGNSAIVGASAILSGVGVAAARRRAEVVEVDLPIAHLPADLDGYRIVQLSDIHAGLTITGDFVRTAVDTANELDADLVALTGDLVDGTVSRLAPQVATIARLRARDGVFFVTGNHEYYWDAPAWCTHLENLGLTVLNNRHRVVTRGDARLLVAGVTDLDAERLLPEHASDPSAALAGAPACDVRLLLAHQPRSAPAAARAGFDLQLSGHTHGGQFFPWTLFIGLAHPYPAGLSRVGEMCLYVSRGTGYWGPPLRLGAPSEITSLRLVHRGCRMAS